VLYGAAAAMMGSTLGVAMLVVAALVLIGVALKRAPEPPARREVERPPARPAAASAAPEREAERASVLLDLARRAARADEAALWRLDAPAGLVRLAARAAGSEEWATPHVIVFDDGPFGTAVSEQTHMHLERGRRELPAPWAAEMLLVPTGRPGELLTLAYADALPDGVEGAAVTAAEALRLAPFG
jgi:hypothetical protein